MTKVNGVEVEVCDWCGMTYPSYGYQYYICEVRDMNEPNSKFIKHKICGDCLDHLKNNPLYKK
jgi:hypothetical protein